MSDQASQRAPVACLSDEFILNNQDDEEMLGRVTASTIAVTLEAETYARFDPQFGQWSRIRVRMYYWPPRSPAPLRLARDNHHDRDERQRQWRP